MKNLVMDFYELTMGQAYFTSHKQDEIAYFDVFFRKVPDNGSYVIATGISEVLEYITNFCFTKEEIDYLRSLNVFQEDYLQYLSKLKFTGDVWCVKDGSVVLPNEPVITVKAPIIQAQLVETAILLLFNHNSLITTKASRIVQAANGRAVMEFGARRAQGETAATLGAKATYLAGVKGTSNTETGRVYGVPVLGTMAHGFVQSFPTEFEAFKAYAESFPDACTLLVDTYNTLKSGVPNAIKTYNEVLKPMGKKLAGVRIDSGDLALLSKKTRQMLDKAGLTDTKIVVSNSLDEYIIESLLQQGAPLDSFGVGEKMITSKDEAFLGGVYKLVAIEKDGEIIPKIKISDNTNKITNPHFKKVYRIYDKENKLLSDLICTHDEEAPKGKLKLYDLNLAHARSEVEEYVAKDIRIKAVENGKLICKIPSVEEVKKHIQEELSTIRDEAKRLRFPQIYTVTLSDKLYNLKESLLNRQY